MKAWGARDAGYRFGAWESQLKGLGLGLGVLD